jgi:EF hand domain-containing protein
MNNIRTLAAVLILGSVVGATTAFAQTTTTPNSGAGVPGLPGNKSGPAARPGEQSTVRPDQSNVPGLPGNKSGPALQPPTGLQNQGQGAEEEEDQDRFFHHHQGMMGMMGRGYGHHGMFEGRRAMSPTMMHIIFSLMDADGDGKLTLQEWQAAHERIFKAMDTDHDGTVTMEEMVTFMRGHQ